MYDLKGGYNLTGVVISGSMWKTVDKVPFFSYLSVLLILGMLAFLSLNVTASAKIFITHVICNVMSPPSLQNFFDFLYLFCDILL